MRNAPGPWDDPPHDSGDDDLAGAIGVTLVVIFGFLIAFALSVFFPLHVPL